MIEEDFLRLSH
uniref:A.thaliana phyD protein n=1 Tax=Arabidopsis thaliana TaxID=3702 RepID=A2NXL6_ARATH|nr:unnamed protein product [Arabidopsis thaliana]